MKEFLTYEEFGAIGDGKHDDFEAIIACHAAANEKGLPVRAKDGASYYIGGSKKCAVIKTDVDFGEAKFIIDDRSLEDIESYVFSVESDFDFEPFALSRLEKGQKKLDFNKKGTFLARVYNENKPIFIRKGLNKNNGCATQEIFLIDNEGNISPSVNFDYPELTTAEAKCVDDKPITLRGGIFVTIANQAESFYNYHQRGFHLTRAHVTITGFRHYMEGELDHGAPYHGFYRSDFAYDLKFSDGIVTPRFTYFTASKVPGKDVPMGSYDLSFWSSMNVSCENVRQLIDITDTRYWGVYTSNFCKNLTLDNCIFSRFDAHMGVTNFKITNSKLGHHGMRLIGFGEGIIENTEVSAYAFFALREDYGSTWEGRITVKNCVWNPTKKFDLFYADNTEEHDFGYYSQEPEEIIFDGIHINDKALGDKPLYLLATFTNEPLDTPKAAPYGRVKRFIVKNLTTERGTKPAICRRPELYPDTEIIVE